MTAKVPVKIYLYSKCQVNSNMVSGDYCSAKKDRQLTLNTY